MNRQEVIDRIALIFVNDFEVEASRIKPEAHLFQDLGLDSLDMVELMVALQKPFSIQMRDSDEARAIRTIGDLQEFVLREMQKGVSPCDSAI